MEKWTLEKLLTDQAINELNRQVETLKSELDRTLQENERLKRRLAEQEEEVDELDGEDENDDGVGNNDGNKRSRLSTESSVKAESATWNHPFLFYRSFVYCLLVMLPAPFGWF